MKPSVWPVSETFAAEIGDLDLSQPLSEADWQMVEEAFRTYAVLVFPDQRISQQQHVDLALRFGPIDGSMVVDMTDAKSRIRADIADVSNLDWNGEIYAEDDRLRLFGHANRLWHTDSSFKKVPAKASLLFIRKIPPVGGHTEFADMRAAWDALPQARQKEIDGLVAMHSIAYSRQKMGFEMTAEENEVLPPVPQTLVRRHADSGRTSIYVASHAGEIDGMSEADGKALLAELLAFGTQRQFVYSHRWRANDLVIWDNRCTLHRGTTFDDKRWRRDAQRATVMDVAPTCEQEGIDAAAE
ncbi:MAG: 2,4-dichlorophenoxyacetate dioxygenase [Rhodospirillaceae bacterium]|nr:2,4-dichlorophenoxyacetate dioxygenase [Rhodospirillaceae bacterium]